MLSACKHVLVYVEQVKEKSIESEMIKWMNEYQEWYEKSKPKSKTMQENRSGGEERSQGGKESWKRQNSEFGTQVNLIIMPEAPRSHVQNSID